jgi:hypothetical protein
MNRTTIPPDALNRFRHAASQVTRNANSRASRLLILKDDIAALRKRKISYRSIGELLTQNGIPTSDVCVMKFCHRHLNEGRARKSSAKQRTVLQASPKSARDVPVKAALPVVPATGGIPISPSVPTVSASKKSRGPRIAIIEPLNPDEKYD